MTKTVLLLVALLLLLVGTYTFFSLAARNEIYFLCGNFKSGVTYSSVVRQLETVKLSDYKFETSKLSNEKKYVDHLDDESEIYFGNQVF